MVNRPKKFIHPITRQRVGLDHFETDTTRNGRPAFPPWAARMIAMRIESDQRHAVPKLTSTRCLTCPRETFISTLLVDDIDLESSWVMHRGTMMHEVAGKYWSDQFISEDEARGEMDLVVVEGEMFGVKLSAQLDVMRKGKDGKIEEIIDLKFPRDESEFFRKRQGGKAKPDHTFQLNVARHLLSQQEWARETGYDPDTVMLTIWDHACGTSRYPSMPEPLAADHMTEAEMLEIKPGGGDYTVEEIVGYHVAAEEVWAELDKIEGLMFEEKRRKFEDLCARIPLVGKTMFNAKKCDKYCGAKDICERLVNLHGEPE